VAVFDRISGGFGKSEIEKRGIGMRMQVEDFLLKK
jgi:hypothetical protein